jgi:hypothetical protein
MKLTEYRGAKFALYYPSFLKVKQRDPEWVAMGTRSSCRVCVLIDPNPVLANAYKEELPRSIASVSGMEALLMRKGEIQIQNGFHGIERLTKLTNGVGEVFWDWLIVGAILNRKIIVHIDSPNEKWGDGKIWAEFVQSIQVTE